MSAKKSGHILTRSGRYFSFERPEEHDFQITDIAWAQSHLCRYTGHYRKLYTVAQHSVIVSYMVPEEDAFEGLMHDASEAYLGDVSSPLKAFLSEYKAMELRTEAAIAKKFGFRFPYPPSIKIVDMRVGATEKRDGMPLTGVDAEHWPEFEPYPPEVLTIEPVGSYEARLMFLDRFYELMEKRK